GLSCFPYLLSFFGSERDVRVNGAGDGGGFWVGHSSGSAGDRSAGVTGRIPDAAVALDGRGSFGGPVCLLGAAGRWPCRSGVAAAVELSGSAWSGGHSPDGIRLGPEVFPGRKDSVRHGDVSRVRGVVCWSAGFGAAVASRQCVVGAGG